MSPAETIEALLRLGTLVNDAVHRRGPDAPVDLLAQDGMVRSRAWREP